MPVEEPQIDPTVLEVTKSEVSTIGVTTAAGVAVGIKVRYQR